MAINKIFTLLFLIVITPSYAQILGCTDPLSKNYNPQATINDGSCKYRSQKIKPDYSSVLGNELKETSGLTAYNSLLWTINDDTDTALYALDSLGEIKNKIVLSAVFNKDWEEIAQDKDYFYIGDFGNNVAGNRKDLHILRIEKKTLQSNVPKIDTIAFSYSNQTDFSPKKNNKTDFDCEALLVTNDSLYLFTKQWSKKNTSLYSLPKTAGKHTATYKNTYNVKGLITGATYSSNNKTIVLCGYNKRLSPFVYLLYDYQNQDFFSGNKRKIKLKLPFHQVEGIATFDGLHYYLSNEHFSRKPFLNSTQKIHRIDLSPYLAKCLIN